MEFKLGRFIRKKSFYSVVGAAAVLQTLIIPAEIRAQSEPLPETSQPTLPAPLLPPRPEAPWVEPADFDQIVDIAAQDMGLPEEYIRRIIDCESSFDPASINYKSGARGWWQIMPVHAEKFIRRGWDYWTDWSNPYRNTKVAGDIMSEQGLDAWDCRNALLIRLLVGV